MKKQTISILGAGKVGIVLAQLALKAGYTVYMAGSADPAKIALSVKILAPGAHAVTKEEAARLGDIVILALPLSKYTSIPRDQLDDKLVIDAMNHWYEVDGPREDIIPDTISSSETVQSYLSTAHVVKAFSHMGYHELYDEARPVGTKGSKAIAIAGDSTSDVATVSTVVNDLGFDSLVIGKLSAGISLEPGHSGFGANLDASSLESLVHQ